MLLGFLIGFCVFWLDPNDPTMEMTLFWIGGLGLELGLGFLAI